jgi:hypothetical protein
MVFDSKDIALRDAKIRKGIFKDVASDIVHTDRHHRKYGYSVDTGGTITREMENAYKLGLAHGSLAVNVAPADPNSPLPWKSIPYGARFLLANIFQYDWILMCRVLPTLGASKSRVTWDCIYGALDDTGSVTDRSKVEYCGSQPNKYVQPLVKLGLLCNLSTPDTLALLSPSDKGVNTFKLACEKGFIFGERPWRIE